MDSTLTFRTSQSVLTSGNSSPMRIRRRKTISTDHVSLQTSPAAQCIGLIVPIITHLWGDSRCQSNMNLLVNTHRALNPG